MNINIKGTGIELTPSITDYATKKISSLEKYLSKKNEDAIFRIEVGRTTKHHKGGEIFKAEVNVSGGGLDLYANAEAVDLYAAIDLVESEISRELLHEKGKQAKLLRRGERIIKDMFKGFRDKFGNN